LRMTWWNRIGLLFAVGFFIAAGYFYREAIRTRDRFAGMPVRIPLSHAPVGAETPEFVAKGGRYYDIEIRQHGAVFEPRENKVLWVVSEQGHLVANGDSTRDQGRDGDDLVVGSFRPEHDGHYKVRVTFRNPVDTSIESASELIVIPDVGERDDVGMGAGILEFAAGVCGFVGLTALTFAVTGIITQRKVVRQEASAVNRG